jgi:hypothetical protein
MEPVGLFTRQFTSAVDTETHRPLVTLLWPALLTFAVVATGMAYSFWWAPIVRHHGGYWVVPGDIWLTVRTAHFVGWGSVSYVYSANAAVVTLPGFSVLLAPVVMLSSALGLTESAPMIGIAKPEAWLLVGPFILLTSGVALAGLDRLAAKLGAVGRARRVLLIAEAAALWPAVALWGHPEDVLAVGLVAFTLVAVADRAWGGAGWLLGIAISMQLFVILLVPLLLAAAGFRHSRVLLLRASLFPGFFLVAVLVPDFHDAWSALTRQPNYPMIDHATPWVLLSPSLGPHVVAAGPARLLGFVAAVFCGIVGRGHRRDLAWLLWLAALAMVARCLFEAVMVPYYVMPAVALAVVVSIRARPLRRALAVLAGASVTVMTFTHANMWAWWFEIATLLLVMVVLAMPRRIVPAEIQHRR